ncbi:apolipoprotein N-acyltransferase [Streptacidiphilus pinicola]|uniref:Apolipoprotein N-acyltransferase n=1 Tax=Streptacidiphilus pinicola TaxID=2219663 RepID=A0A2X0IHX7_9ACTN|nr:apolipoprotein N-acyltransferase [Streptacidiphilus pinicola]
MGEQDDASAPRDGGRRSARFWGRARGPLLAALTGALPVLIFPAPGWWWFAYVCLVPLLLVLRAAPTPRRAAWLGWWGGIGFLLGVMSWLIPSLGPAILVLAAFLGGLWAPWGWLVHRLLHGTPDAGRALAALVLIPTGWLLTETVRSWQYLGGPWGLLGASQYQQHFALRLASVGGVWLDSLVIVAVNTAVVVLLAAWGRSAVAWLTLLSLGAATAAVTLWAPAPHPTGRTAAIGVVQPGMAVANDAVGDRTVRGEQLSGTLAASRPDLVLWGESSVSFDLDARPDLATGISRVATRTGADVLVNVDAVRPGRGGIYKSSVLVGPEGVTGQRYDKIRLVPFGEYIPLRPVLGFVKDFSKAAGVDRRRGSDPVVMTVPTRDGGTLKVGPLICFESAFPDMSRALVQRGAQVILVQSATPTFQSTWAPEQHASLAALRAAETGRPVVQATLTGVSVAYDANGRQTGTRLGKDASAATVYTVSLTTGDTLYVRWGNWVPTGSALVLLLSGGVWAVSARRNRVREAGAGKPETPSGGR